MDSEQRRQRQAHLERAVREAGLPLTVQRRVIFEAVLDLGGHPTADQVHGEVRRRLDGISRTTVYRTLETLVRLEVITKACHPGTAVRFDAETGLHHHLVCMRCDRVEDIHDARLDTLPVPDTTSFGFEVKDFRVQLRGLCRRCREEEVSS